MRRYLSLLRGLQLDFLLKELQQLLRQGGTLAGAATNNTTNTKTSNGAAAAVAKAPEAVASALGSGVGAGAGAGRGKGGPAGGVPAPAAGGSGGRSSFSLPSRECVVHVMAQVLKGTALIRGMQGPLERCGAQLCAQMALTYFLPFASVAMGMLARIKVRATRRTQVFGTLISSPS